jgi:hypothetical protein
MATHIDDDEQTNQLALDDDKQTDQLALDDEEQENSWDEVYYMCLFSQVSSDAYKEYHGWIYYQTYGGGPEGGFLVNDGKVCEVSRSWVTGWEIKPITGKVEHRHYYHAQQMAWVNEVKYTE